MCCCGRPVVNGELGYKWQPNDVPGIRPVNPPKIGENETLLFDEPGRCGGLDCHSHHFRVVKHAGSSWLLVKHGGGEERIRLFHLAVRTLEGMDHTTVYWLLHTIYSAHREGADNARDTEAAKWRKAAAEKRIKTRKMRGGVKVWIEAPLVSGTSVNAVEVE